MGLIDKQMRVIKYLRISVTDKCNLKCRYCTSEEDERTHAAPLSFEDMLFAASVFFELGISRVRLTGGEPLVRREVSDFIKGLKAIGLEDISITTNGTLLSKYAKDIASVGVNRINISLDSLNSSKYNYITKSNDFDQVISGIECVRGVFSPIKVNVVVMRGFNEEEILDFCKFAADNKVIVRFIEFMPLSNTPNWREKVVSGEEILNIVSQKYGVTPLAQSAGAGPAQKYLLSNGAEIGLITPISKHFCKECDRLRLMADGQLRICLLSQEEVSLKDVIVSRNKERLTELVRQAVNKKKPEHNIKLDGSTHFERVMQRIGG